MKISYFLETPVILVKLYNEFTNVDILNITCLIDK